MAVGAHPGDATIAGSGLARRRWAWVLAALSALVLCAVIVGCAWLYTHALRLGRTMIVGRGYSGGKVHLGGGLYVETRRIGSGHWVFLRSRCMMAGVM